jgi:hypothetical protein
MEILSLMMCIGLSARSLAMSLRLMSVVYWAGVIRETVCLGSRASATMILKEILFCNMLSVAKGFQCHVPKEWGWE